MKRKNKKTKFSTKLLICTLLIYLAVAIFNFPFAREAFLGFLAMILRVAPILFAVVAIMTFTNLFLTTEKVEKYLGRNSGKKSWLYVIISGVIISGPPYVLYPLLGELKKKGMKDSLLATFLFNRNVKIPFIPVMIYYFGLPFTVIMSTYIILFSVLNGILVSKFTNSKS